MRRNESSTAEGDGRSAGMGWAVAEAAQGGHSWTDDHWSRGDVREMCVQAPGIVEVYMIPRMAEDHHSKPISSMVAARSDMARDRVRARLKFQAELCFHSLVSLDILRACKSRQRRSPSAACQSCEHRDVHVLYPVSVCYAQQSILPDLPIAA